MNWKLAIQSTQTAVGMEDMLHLVWLLQQSVKMLTSCKGPALQGVVTIPPPVSRVPVVKKEVSIAVVKKWRENAHANRVILDWSAKEWNA